jgi:hypothetical protein
MSLEKSKLIAKQITELSYKNELSIIKDLLQEMKQEIIEERKKHV